MNTADQSKHPLQPKKNKTPARYDPPPPESVGGVGELIALFPPPQDEENPPPWMIPRRRRRPPCSCGEGMDRMTTMAEGRTTSPSSSCRETLTPNRLPLPPPSPPPPSTTPTSTLTSTSTLRSPSSSWEDCPCHRHLPRHLLSLQAPSSSLPPRSNPPPCHRRQCPRLPRRPCCPCRPCCCRRQPGPCSLLRQSLTVLTYLALAVRTSTHRSM